jgi:toxin YoeB
MKICFTETGWKDYQYWESQDKKTLKQINKLIADIERNGYDGVGKPEPRVAIYPGGSRVVLMKKNRLVYRLIGNDAVEISQCKDHYGDK